MFATNEALIIPETLELQQLRIGLALTATRETARLRDPLEDATLAALVETTPGDLQVYRGRWLATHSDVAVLGPGGTTTGDTSGRFIGYDYRSAYQVYDLAPTAPAKDWFANYSRAHDNSELIKTFEESDTMKLSHHLKFTLQGNDQGISRVFIYYETIRIRFEGQTKDYVVTNLDSSGAAAPDGSPYPGFAAGL